MRWRLKRKYPLFQVLKRELDFFTGVNSNTFTFFFPKALCRVCVCVKGFLIALIVLLSMLLVVVFGSAVTLGGVFASLHLACGCHSFTDTRPQSDDGLHMKMS